MLKFLLALNLVCVMFISGCSKAGGAKLKEDSICGNSCNLKFNIITKTQFFINPSFNNSSISLYKINKNDFPNDVSNDVSKYIIDDYLSLYVKFNSPLYEKLLDFYTKYGKLNEETENLNYKKYYFYNLENVQLQLTYDYNLARGYMLTSFSAEIPNKN